MDCEHEGQFSQRVTTQDAGAIGSSLEDFSDSNGAQLVLFLLQSPRRVGGGGQGRGGYEVCSSVNVWISRVFPLKGFLSFF